MNPKIEYITDILNDFLGDTQYDPEGKFEKKYGRQAIIFRKHKNC